MNTQPRQDPKLGALDVALSNSGIIEVLEQHLTDCVSGALSVKSCQLHGVRYKPGTSCLLRYKLELHDTQADSTINTLAHVRLYGSTRRAERVWSDPSLARLLQRASRLDPNPPVGRAAYVPQMKAIVQLYPVDMELPALVCASSPRTMCEALRDALPEGMGSAVRNCDVKVVRYKSTHRATLRYRLKGAEIDAVYGKLRADDRGAALFDMGRALGKAGVATPAPLAYLPDLRMQVHAEMPGTLLAKLRTTAEFQALLAPIAGALARLHATRLAGLPAYSPRHEAESVLAAGWEIGRLLPGLAPETTRLATTLAAELDMLASPPVTIHGDFHDRQVLISDVGVVLLDFDGARLGNAAFDAGSFLAQLSSRRKGPPGAAADARAIFLDAYAALRPAARGAAILFEASALLRSALGAFRRLHPEWPGEIERLVRLAAQRMEEHRRTVHCMPATAQQHARDRAPAADSGAAPGGVHVVRRKGLPADPILPQLQIASDPGLMLEVFRRHMRSVTSQAYHIRECRLSRIRYRRADRCVLQYTLRLVEPRTGRELSQWVTGVLYAGDRTERIWRKLRSGDPGQQIPEAFRTLEPVSFIPDLRMLVQVFPYDRRLSTLPLLTAGPPPDLQPLLLRRFGPGDWQVEHLDVEPVRYRAELGVVLRYAVEARDAATGRREEKRFYVKVYRDEEGERTYQALKELWRRADSGGEGFTVGRPIAYVSSLRALFQEESAGISLQQVLLEGSDAVAAVRKAARAVAALHLGQAVTTRRHRFQDEIAALRRAERLLRCACPHLGAEVTAIVGAIVAGLEEVPLGPTHLDLKPDHILLDGDRLALLDLDFFAEADPVLDAASMLAHLAGMPFRFPNLDVGRCRTAARAFAEEYFGRVPDAWRARLPFHYSGAALKVAVGFYRRQELDWPEKAAALVGEARDSMAGEI